MRGISIWRVFCIVTVTSLSVIDCLVPLIVCSLEVICGTLVLRSGCSDWRSSTWASWYNSSSDWRRKTKGAVSKLETSSWLSVPSICLCVVDILGWLKTSWFVSYGHIGLWRRFKKWFPSIIMYNCFMSICRLGFGILRHLNMCQGCQVFSKGLRNWMFPQQRQLDV